MAYKLTALPDFSCSWSLSAIRAINSELVGLPFVLLTVYLKNNFERTSFDVLSFCTQKYSKRNNRSPTDLSYQISAKCNNL